MVEYGRDPSKEAENVRQHGVSFDDAIVALCDPFGVEWFDLGHSADEPRFVKIGRDLRGRFLTVVTSDGGHGPRIISHGAPRSANEMPTNTSDPLAPARRSATGGIAGWHGKPSTNGFGIVIDGAVGYSLRLTPSNKLLGEFATTREAWHAVIQTVESGRSPRTLVLDWHGVDGSRGPVSSGRTLEYLARSGLGLPADHLRSPDQHSR